MRRQLVTVLGSTGSIGRQALDVVRARSDRFLLFGISANENIGLLIEQESLMGRWMDIITIYVVPIGAILGAVMIYWVLGVKNIKHELMEGRDKPLSRAYDFLAKYVYVFLALVVVICSFVIPGGIG